MKKYLTRRESKAKRNLPRFHPIVSIIALVFGILATLFVTHVLAQVANTQINACVNKSSGTLHIVEANTTCANNETLLTWNQQSIQGPPGPAGTGGDTFSERPFICISCFLSPYADKFAGKDFSNSQLLNSSFLNANIQGIILKNSFAGSMDLRGANIGNADLSNLLPGGNRSTIVFFANNTNFTNTNLTNDHFEATNFSGANFLNANFTNASFGNQTTFLNAQNMSTANLTGVTWSNTTCPDGTNSDNDGNTCVGHF